MPSSNHRSHQRSSSTRSSRHTHTGVNERNARSSSTIPYRQFIIILTNNPDLLRHTRQFQPQVKERNQQIQNF